MRTQLNVRVPQTTTDQIAALLSRGYESQAHVVMIAVNNLYLQETQTMNRQQFAHVTAAAYVAQFSTDPNPVMNERVIVFDGKEFGSQSSLTPVFDGETVVMSLEDGMFGDVDADRSDAKAEIESYLNDSASNEIWQSVKAAIAEAAA